MLSSYIIFGILARIGAGECDAEHVAAYYHRVPYYNCHHRKYRKCDYSRRVRRRAGARTGRQDSDPDV